MCCCGTSIVAVQDQVGLHETRIFLFTPCIETLPVAAQTIQPIRLISKEQNIEKQPVFVSGWGRGIDST